MHHLTSFVPVESTLCSSTGQIAFIYLDLLASGHNLLLGDTEFHTGFKWGGLQQYLCQESTKEPTPLASVDICFFAVFLLSHQKAIADGRVKGQTLPSRPQTNETRKTGSHIKISQGTPCCFLGQPNPDSDTYFGGGVERI